jgi:hypothetical protein
MPTINPNDSFNRIPQSDVGQNTAGNANPADAEDFEGLLGQETPQTTDDLFKGIQKLGSQNQRGTSLFDGFSIDPNRKAGSLFDGFSIDPNRKAGSLFDGFVIDENRKPDSIFKDLNTDNNAKPADGHIDIDNYQPDKPDVPSPQEQPKNFWQGLWGGVKKTANDVGKFIASPEFAKFARAANIVFAGAMVVTAGVLFATGVGAPAGIAALALAGGAGLAMQLPAVNDKLQAGVVALLTPVLGQETAEKLGPIATQGLISGLMIAMVVTGGQAANAQGALNAISGVFKNMGDFFNTASQVYQGAGPILQMFGVNLDATALAQAGSMFGVLGGLMPDMAKFADGMGQSLKDFLLNPDMAKFSEFLKSAVNVPESIANLMDSNFLKGLGGLLSEGEQFLTDFNQNDFMKNFLALLQIVGQGAKLTQA